MSFKWVFSFLHKISNPSRNKYSIRYGINHQLRITLNSSSQNLLSCQYHCFRNSQAFGNKNMNTPICFLAAMMELACLCFTNVSNSGWSCIVSSWRIHIDFYPSIWRRNPNQLYPIFLHRFGASNCTTVLTKQIRIIKSHLIKIVNNQIDNMRSVSIIMIEITLFS